MDPQVLVRLEQLVHPGARYFRSPLPEEANAWPLWREPLEQITFNLPTLPMCSSLAELASKGADRLRKLLAANERHLESIDAGIARGRLQFPEPLGPGHFHRDAGRRLKSVANPVGLLVADELTGLHAADAIREMARQDRLDREAARDALCRKASLSG